MANSIPSTYYYHIKIPATKVDILLPFISVTPNTCSNGYLGIGLDYKFLLESIALKPAFLTKATDKFTLKTSDTSDRGTWTVQLVISPNAQSSSAYPIVKTYTFILSACKLSNPCPFELSLTQASMAQGTYDNTIA